MAASFSSISSDEKQALNSKIIAAGISNSNNQGIVKLKMFVNNLQVQKITSFPKHDLEFVAEVVYI